MSAAPERERVTIRLDAEVRRRLDAEAVAAGCSRNALVAAAASELVGLNGARATNGRGRRHALARLADRHGEFSADDAGRELGLGPAATAHHLREMVRAGLLEERVVEGATGGRKAYRAAGG